jgi:hypothetical protein
MILETMTKSNSISCNIKEKDRKNQMGKPFWPFGHIFKNMNF